MPDIIYTGTLKQKVEGGSVILHPETEAGKVTYSGNVGGTAVTNVKDALDSIITAGVGVTGVKGDAESTYRTGQVNLTPANIGAEAAFTDGSATIASVGTGANANIVTIKAGVAQSGGAISNSSGSDIVLAKVAKTGAYGDLSGTPTIGTGVLTIKAGGTSKGTFSANATSGVEIDITAADLGLSSALRYLGQAQTTVPTAGQYVQTVIGSTTYYIPVTDSGTATEIAAQRGDVIVVGSKEYVCNTAGTHGTNAFQEIGDESSYALKTVTISAGTGLTGGGTLEADRTISLADNYGDTKNPYAAKTKNTVLAGPDGSSGHTADAAPTFRALVAADIPDLSGSYIARPNPDANIGSSTQSIYYNSTTGQLAAGSTYAGGTKVTLNGTDKGASTASFYAPTTAISESTSKMYLVGSTSTTSVAEEHTNSSVYMQSGKLYSNGSEVLTGNQTITTTVNSGNNAGGSAITGSGSGATSITVTLGDSGVTAGSYSAVTVNAKGIVTDGAQMLAVIENGGSTTGLATGGWYFEKDPVSA